MHNKYIINLMGPTGSGKTALAELLCTKYNMEPINVDSALIYRDMNIGTAKPSKAEIAALKYHLVDIIEPTTTYSVAEFYHDALQAIEAILHQGKIPLLVGGTMMYFKSLLYGLNQLPSSTPEVRAKVNKLAVEYGWDYIYDQLCLVDQESGARLHKNDHQRVGRALEVFYLTGKPMSVLLQETSKPSLPYKFINIALLPEKDRLDDLIWQRLDEMLQDDALINEVKYLTTQYALDKDLPSMRSVGYKEVLEYLNNEVDYQEMRLKIFYATRQLAKRQYTWLRNWSADDIIKLTKKDSYFLEVTNILQQAKIIL